MTSGRHTASSLLGGLPIIMVTTIGRKSGLPRSVPLIGLPSGEDLAVVGSNFGGARAPGWVHNLAANPMASVRYRERSSPVIARLADGDETKAVFAAGAQVYPGYGEYRQRASHRTIRVYVLEPTAGVGS